MTKRLGTTVRSEPVAATDDDEGPWFLWIVDSPDRTAAGTAVALLARETRIGRQPDPGPHVRLTIDDDRVSRLHAAVLTDASHARIADCESSNGLFVDGARVSGAELSPGSVIRVGDTAMVLDRGEPAPPDDERGLEMVGRSPSLVSLRTLVRRVAPSGLAVMISGETGTGKERVARALHDGSGRTGAFVPVNCAALPAQLVESILFGHRRGAFTGATSDQEGAFVRAHGGTLFLDEVGELSLEAQPKLLRVLEDGDVTPVGAGRATPVDVRVLAATNVPLEGAVKTGRFRADLFARLAGVEIETPPLCDRRQDILPLFRHFLPAPTRARPLSADFVEALLLHEWPQNVRELAKLAERLAVLHPEATRWELSMLDEELRRSVLERKAPAPVAAVAGPPSRDALLALLAQFGGNVSLLAKHVGRNRKQVYRWMDDLDISRGTGRDA